MQFEWDKLKAERNERKHGITFRAASRVFLDLNRIESYDGRGDYGEDRWITIGSVENYVLYVVYAVRDDEVIRLISARKANETERQSYYGQIFH